MCIFYFDSGTTNTRGYLIYHDGRVVGKKIAFGSKDISLSGNRDLLPLELKKLYDEILFDEGLSDSQVNGIYASGMVTSPYGLHEVSHLLLPVDAVKLRKNMYSFYESQYFKRTIHLIRGTKTREENISLRSIDQVNNTRGEEIEAVGIAVSLNFCRQDDPFIVLFPGSHTHAIKMKGRSIEDVWSMFSGELFYSLTNATVLSAEVEKDTGIPPDEESVVMGCRFLSEYGMARALYLVHASKMFHVGSNVIRRDMLNGIIIGSVMQSLKIVIDTKWSDTKKLLIYGATDIVKQHIAAARCIIPNMEIISLESSRDDLDYSVRGLLEMIARGE